MESHLMRLLDEYLDSPKAPPSGVVDKIEVELRRFVRWCQEKAADPRRHTVAHDYCLTCNTDFNWRDRSHDGHLLLSRSPLLTTDCGTGEPQTLGISVSDGVGAKSKFG